MKSLGLLVIVSLFSFALGNIVTVSFSNQSKLRPGDCVRHLGSRYVQTVTIILEDGRVETWDGEYYDVNKYTNLVKVECKK